MMDLGEEGCPRGGRVRCQESEVLAPDSTLTGLGGDGGDGGDGTTVFSRLLGWSRVVIV